MGVAKRILEGIARLAEKVLMYVAPVVFLVALVLLVFSVPLIILNLI